MNNKETRKRLRHFADEFNSKQLVHALIIDEGRFRVNPDSWRKLKYTMGYEEPPIQDEQPS